MDLFWAIDVAGVTKAAATKPISMVNGFFMVVSWILVDWRQIAPGAVAV